MKITLENRYSKDSPSVLIKALVLLPESEAEKFQVQALSDQMKANQLLNYDEADAPYRSSQITIPLIDK